jgi:hypothetical protein
MRALRYVALIGVIAAAGYLAMRTTTHVAAQAASGCDVTSMNSAYGFVQSGFSYDSNGYLYVMAGNGRVAGDGNGNLTGADTLNYDGTVYRRTFTGTYTINSDCTGTVALTFSDKTTMHADIVVTNDGKEIAYNGTDTDFIYSGTWKRLNQSGTVVTPTASDSSAFRRQ